MLWMICAVLVVLWLVGVVAKYTMGGLLHILLIVALVVMLMKVFQG
jgi:hypothetical protein